MAQNREKDETVDLQVPSETTLSLPLPHPHPHPHPHPDPNPTTSGCGSISLDPTRVPDRRRPRSADDTPTTPTQINEQKKRKASDLDSDLKVEVVVVKKKAVNRCSGCRKRVGLTGFTCRCGDLFCAEHRYSDRHDCSFDYKTAGRAAIARENPVVRAAKILKV